MAQPSNPDLQLVQKAVNGNRKAFTTLFNRYFQSVYNFALMLSRNPAMAEDLTQEAFIRAHAKLDSLGPPWNFRAWIFRLTRNYFIDLTRKEREVDQLEEGDHVISPSPTPEKEAMSRDVTDRVQTTLGRLSVQHREILVLRELNEFSYGEIGDILNISSSNVKVSLHRARAAFQESYGIQLLLEDPTGDCQEVAGLLHAFHDNEELLDQERFVKEHLKVCEECRERRQLLITQSVILGAFVPVIPPKSLKQRILQETANPTTGPSASKSGKVKSGLGIGGGTAVLGVMAWFVVSLIFNTKSILPNFPGGKGGDRESVAGASEQLSPT
ncbi:MAG: sigma-70 family RNA polymerase sigma factor, partial [Chloroflexi bacterium]|nr:sigma-70 family RNA polymerase sigma factor [Chloroflexota bacterium]